MRYPSRLFVVVVCLFACLAVTSPAWAQSGSPVVYVSGGSSILSVNATTGVVTTLVSNSAATYEGLVVGPDNVDGNNPGYLLYACDPTHNTILRLDPNNAPFQGGQAAETVYQGNGAAGTLVAPQCGRFTNVGDLMVTSKVAGSGFWDIAGVANIPFGKIAQNSPLSITPNAPDAAFSATQVDQGIAQKNIGDILVVDTANGEVIRTPYTGSGTFSAPASVFIGPSSTLLPGPYGIAKKSDGEIYISNQSKKTNDIVLYSAQGTNGTVCVPSTVFKKYTPFFMQMSADDTLYVAAAGSSSGVIFSVNTATCAATQLSSLLTLPPLSGIALPPTTVSQMVQNFSGNQIFNFNFAAFEFNSTSCSLTVTAIPENLAAVNAYIANAVTNDPTNLGFGAVPAVDLGRDGFETAFQFDSSGCAPDLIGQNSDGLNAEFLAAQIDNQLVPNPRVLHCDANCAVVETFGDYPLGGLLPLDTTLSGRDSGSVHFLVSENTSNSTEPGTFCGFETPLSSTPPPGIAGVFSSGQTLSLKFELAQGANNPGGCQNGPFITDATALLSVAQIFDNHGNPVFVPNTAIDASGNSTPVQPIFKNDPANKQYQFSLSLKGYAKGIYSLTITFLSSNTSYQVAEIQVQ